MANTERPKFSLHNWIGYTCGLAVGSPLAFYMIDTGDLLNISPLRLAGFVLLGYQGLYVMSPIIWDFGPAIKRLERNSKTFLTAKGERTISVGGPVKASSLARLDRKQRKQMHLQVQEPEQVVATRDVVFYHNRKPISGKVYSQWLERGYTLQVQFARDGKTASGLAKRQRGDIAERYWKRMYDILDYTVQYYIAERGIVLAENKNGGYHLRVKPGVVYDCSCTLLL